MQSCLLHPSIFFFTSLTTPSSSLNKTWTTCLKAQLASILALLTRALFIHCFHLQFHAKSILQLCRCMAK